MTTMLRRAWARLAASWRRSEDDRRLAEELDLHLALETDSLVARGMAPEDARREAARRLGGRVAIEERWREERRLPWVDVLRQDLRYAVRGLRRDARFTALALLTLATGIGATTAIFGLLRGVMLEPLPYPDPDRLVRVYESNDRFPAFPVSPWSYQVYRREARTLAEMGVYAREDLHLSMDDRPERLRALQVSASYFRVLGVAPAIGRTFATADEHANAALVVVSHDLWRRRFGGDPGIVGRTVRLSGRSFTVIGVMPARFEHVGGAFRSLPQGETVDAWWPVALEQARDRRHWHNLNAVARLAPGATPAQARDELDAIAARLATTDLDGTRWFVRTRPLADDVVGSTREGLTLLMGAVALVLVIACANVSSLLLARATARRRERAVRFALGASRARLVRQAMTESAVLMVPAALLGAAAAWLGTRGLHLLLPPDFPRLHNVQVDAEVLTFCAALCGLAVVVFGIVSSWRDEEEQPAALHDGGTRTSAGRRTTRLRHGLVIGEIALASALLVAGGLLVQSFVRLQQAEPGFVPEGAVTAAVALPEARYGSPDSIARFMDTLTTELRALPGVRAAGAGSAVPWTGYDENTGFDIVGREGRQPQPNARFQAATTGYFEALGMRLVTGRLIEPGDRAGAPPVVVVNEAFARKFLPNDSPTDHAVDFWGAKRAIVGVVGDVMDQPADREAVPGVWLPHAQLPFAGQALIVRTGTADPGAIVPDVRRVLARLDPQLPLAEVRTLEEIAAAANAQRRFLLVMTLLFAMVALALAGLGAYGVLSWTVRQRTRELAIRMALGADGGQVIGLVLGQGLRLAVLGLGMGLAIAFASARALSGLLYGVSAQDHSTYAAAAVVVLVLCALAALGPALSATRTSPIDALRAD